MANEREQLIADAMKAGIALMDDVKRSPWRIIGAISPSFNRRVNRESEALLARLNDLIEREVKRLATHPKD